MRWMNAVVPGVMAILESLSMWSASTHKSFQSNFSPACTMLTAFALATSCITKILPTMAAQRVSSRY